MLLEPIIDLIQRSGIHDADDLAAAVPDDIILAMMERLEAEMEEERFGKFRNLFPDEYHQIGDFKFWPRHLYQKHLEFFRAGKTHRARCFLAANRVGKTMSGGGFEITCHLTGIYPTWWEGKTFRAPIRAWACGKTNETTRDIVQTTLLGDVAYHGSRKLVDGSGVIPRGFPSSSPCARILRSAW